MNGADQTPKELAATAPGRTMSTAAFTAAGMHAALHAGDQNFAAEARVESEMRAIIADSEARAQSVADAI